MFRRLTSRRTLKGTGTIGCVLVAAVLLASAWYRIAFAVELGAHGVEFGVSRGCLFAAYDDVPGVTGHWAQMKQFTRMFDRWGDHPELEWWPTSLLQLSPLPADVHWWVNVPLWIPFLLLAMPTAWLWRLDRRRPLVGHCPKCDYNLTGNTSGRCPECGATVPNSVAEAHG